MEKECKFGKMAQGMKEIGVSIKPTVKEHSGMYMEISMRVSGETTKPMGTESILTRMELNMQVIGKMICKMV